MSSGVYVWVSPYSIEHLVLRRSNLCVTCRRTDHVEQERPVPEPDVSWEETVGSASMYRFEWNGLRGLVSRETWMMENGYVVYGSSAGPSRERSVDYVWCEAIKD